MSEDWPWGRTRGRRLVAASGRRRRLAAWLQPWQPTKISISIGDSNPFDLTRTRHLARNLTLSARISTDGSLRGGTGCSGVHSTGKELISDVV